MRKERQKETTLPDPRFNDQLVTFCEQLNVDGKNRQL
jgi:hypothetical protein